MTRTGERRVSHKPAPKERRNPAGHDPRSLEQAKAVAILLPTLMRQMFTLRGDAVTELPLAQLRVCAILYEEPRSMSALSRALGITLSAMTQLADRLERVGLVERVAEGSDRRVRRLRLTGRGEAMMRDREAERTGCVLAAFEYLSPASRNQVLDALQALMKACDASKRGAGGPQTATA